HPNDTYRFADVPKTGIKVSRGMTHDGIGKYVSDIVHKAEGSTDDVVGILKETNTDVVVNYLPVGSEEATKWYTEQILNAGCAMVNCMPVFIARERYWQKRFEDAGVPIIGDDIKSQVGATITHRVLTSLFRDRGVRLAKLALNNGIAGALEGPSAYLMKSPPKQIRDDDAREGTERFIRDNKRAPKKAPAKA